MLRKKIIDWGNIRIEVRETTPMQVIYALAEHNKALKLLFPQVYGDDDSRVEGASILQLEWDYAEFIVKAIMRSTVEGFDFPTQLSDEGITTAWEMMETSIPNGLYKQWKSALEEVDIPPGDPDLAPDISDTKKKTK